MSNQANNLSSETPPIVAGIVDGSGKFVEAGGITNNSNAVTLIGTSSPNSTVAIYDNTSRLDEVKVDNYGRWYLLKESLPIGAVYKIFAKATTGEQLESKDYTFTVPGGPPTK